MLHTAKTARTLRVADWEAERERHRARMRVWVDPHLERQGGGRKHPVYDFLFTYYSFRPSALMSWSPGFQVGLKGPGADEFLSLSGFVRDAECVRQDPNLFPASRLRGLRWVVDLLQQTALRAPTFGCHGLHEWAMVYQQHDVRHAQCPLRLSPDELAAFVESQRIYCSHYDAFRFFTPPARPLNQLQPGPQNRSQFEQPGCLHANMDLYKWAYKFYPWVDSDLVADTFALAVEARELDMRASPYDLTELGFEAIPIETEQGRATYRTAQQVISDKSVPLRHKLTTTLSQLHDWVVADTPPCAATT